MARAPLAGGPLRLCETDTCGRGNLAPCRIQENEDGRVRMGLAWGPFGGMIPAEVRGTGNWHPGGWDSLAVGLLSPLAELLPGAVAHAAARILSASNYEIQLAEVTHHAHLYLYK